MSDENKIFKSIKVIKNNINNQIADQIQELIEKKQLQAGSKLPSERSLASILGINRATLREAIRILEVRGLLTTDIGRGAYISYIKPSIVTESLKRYRIFGDCSLDDIMEIRERIEPEIAGLAAIKCTEDDLEKLKKQIEVINRYLKLKNREKYILADEIFHQLITEATYNQLFIAIMKGLRVILLPMKQEIISEFWIDNKEEHLKIYDAICSKDSSAAVEAMKEHMLTSRYYYDLQYKSKKEEDSIK